MIIYSYSKCSTCRQALSFLKQLNITVEIKEINETPPSIDELKFMLKYQNDHLKKLFNTSGILYREMGLSQKLSKLELQQALELLSSNGMLVKRPFLLADNLGLVGFNKEEWSEKLHYFI